METEILKTRANPQNPTDPANITERTATLGGNCGTLGDNCGTQKKAADIDTAICKNCGLLKATPKTCPATQCA